MRAVLFLLFALLYAGSASAQQQSGGGGAPMSTTPAGPVNVGTVLNTAPVPAGATCQWTRDGSTNIPGATNCATYTTVTADGGHTVRDVVTLTGVSVTASGTNAANFFFPNGLNVMHLGLIF